MATPARSISTISASALPRWSSGRSRPGTMGYASRSSAQTCTCASTTIAAGAARSFTAVLSLDIGFGPSIERQRLGGEHVHLREDLHCTLVGGAGGGDGLSGPAGGEGVVEELERDVAGVA